MHICSKFLQDLHDLEASLVIPHLRFGRAATEVVAPAWLSPTRRAHLCASLSWGQSSSVGLGNGLFGVVPVEWLGASHVGLSLSNTQMG